MALDGIMLNKLVPEIRSSLPARIQKIYEISSTEILFQLHGNAGKQQLLISCHSVYNRLLLTKRSYPTPKEPGNFIMLLRKYLEGATIENIEQKELDRWGWMSIRRRNNLGDPEIVRLIFELMGNYANVILVGSDGRIIDALKRIPPFTNDRRTVFPGAEYTEIESQHKTDPFTATKINTELSLTVQFGGFSPFLSKEVEYRMSHGQSFTSIMQEIRESDSVYVAEGKDTPVFHCIPLEHIGPCRKYPLFEAFDILYYHREEKERIKQITGDLFHLCKKELKHQTQKLPRLLAEYDSALDCDKYRKYGDLLFTYNVTDTKGRSEIELEDYESGESIHVPLDVKLDGRGNARKCYQKYNKLKKGQVHLQEQIAITKNEITYFTGLLEQLDLADFAVAEEIRNELVKGGYLKPKAAKNRKKKKEQAPAYTSITAPSGIVISYGRNNLQNDALTWHSARKNEIWLHTKDYHGSHVVIHNDNPDEETLRLAAMIAAWFSKGRESSSVPVNWCPVRNLKKIPGAKPGMIQLGSYKTIYIDPDAEYLASVGIRL